MKDKTWEGIYKDAERFRWLLANCVSYRAPDTYGPACPKLHMLADLWNADPQTPAKDRIIKEVDRRMDEGQAD